MVGGAVARWFGISIGGNAALHILSLLWEGEKGMCGRDDWVGEGAFVVVKYQEVSIRFLEDGDDIMVSNHGNNSTGDFLQLSRAGGLRHIRERCRA